MSEKTNAVAWRIFSMLKVKGCEIGNASVPLIDQILAEEFPDEIEIDYTDVEARAHFTLPAGVNWLTAASPAADTPAVAPAQPDAPGSSPANSEAS